jgi:pimeloyl-ACP methyl ester carboxylesterase
MPVCATRLLLADCLERRQREAEFGVCDTGRYRCRYVAWGRGPTLVLIPGLASEALSFVLLMARLQSHFRCISYDLPDGVADGARMSRYRHVDLVADLFALLDHLQVADCVVSGSSFGSTIALQAIQQAPSRFTHGVLQAGFARRPLAPMEVLGASFVRFAPGRVAHLPFVLRVLGLNHHVGFQGRDEVWDFFLERTLNTPLRAFASRLLMTGKFDLRATLPSIRTPMFMVCGDCDQVVGRACEQDLMRGLPNLTRIDLEACGHEMHLTHPEVLGEALMRVLMPSQCEAGCG